MCEGCKLGNGEVRRGEREGPNLGEADVSCPILGLIPTDIREPLKAYYYCLFLIGSNKYVLWEL